MVNIQSPNRQYFLRLDHDFLEAFALGDVSIYASISLKLSISAKIGRSSLGLPDVHPYGDYWFLTYS